MRILIGLVVLALALPASAALVNGDFEDGLNGWTVSAEVRINGSQYTPNPSSVVAPTELDQAAPVAGGESRASDDNCNARNSLGWQEAYCPVDPAKECKDGCAAKGTASACRDGACVALRHGEPDPGCTRRDVDALLAPVALDVP